MPRFGVARTSVCVRNTFGGKVNEAILCIVWRQSSAFVKDTKVECHPRKFSKDRRQPVVWWREALRERHPFLWNILSHLTFYCFLAFFNAMELYKVGKTYRGNIYLPETNTIPCVCASPFVVFFYIGGSVLRKGLSRYFLDVSRSDWVA